VPDDAAWMELAIGLSRQCLPADDAYCVGAVIVDDSGQEIARGYSREAGDRAHAEEAALAKAAGDPRLRRATLYSTLEPCSRRASRPLSCARLIIDAGIPRVVFAWREPPLFVADARGGELLAAAGVAVTELPGFAATARAVNSHLPLAE
jgi:diaminohydroxyphosphoribosylaminopyrimidine deaminase / 5-amino-6-(5-phosphoribosylamino)uracil reductase